MLYKYRNTPAHYLTRRIINDSTISEFQLNLSYESWENVFNGDDVDTIFNNFLNMYLRTFYHTFPLTRCQHTYYNKPWITPGIIISSQHKRNLYILCRSTKDSKLNNHYKKHSRILSDIIKIAKKRFYNKLLLTSNNKSKTAWHIIKSETNKTKCNHGISSIEIEGKICNDHLVIAKGFNTYFTSLTDKIFMNSVNTHSTPSNVCPLHYPKQAFVRPFP